MPAELLVVSETEQLLLAPDEPELLVVDQPGAAELLQVAEQGPPGPAGSTKASYPSAGTVQGHKVVMLAADGAVAHADSAVPAHVGAVIGVSLNAAAPPDQVLVQFSGDVDHPGWAWVPDAPVFVGNAGALVQPQPAGAAWLQIVGWARSPTRLLVQINPPISIGA